MHEIDHSFALVKSFYLQRLRFIAAVAFNLKLLALRGAPVLLHHSVIRDVD